MNLQSTKLGKSIAIAVSACFLWDTATNIAFALRNKSNELVGGFVFSLILFIVLYVNFWRAKDWARYTLGVLLTLRCGLNLRLLFEEAADTKAFPTFDLAFCILFGALGVALLTVPGVPRFLRSIYASEKNA